MRCLVNGQELPASQLARVPMNFGQPFPLSGAPVSYRMSIAAEEFVRLLGDVYAKAIKEEIADAPFHKAGEWPTLDRLQSLGYPPLEDLLAREPEVLAGLVKEWLVLETLDQLIPGPDTGLPRFLVSTVDRVTLASGCLLIEGQAYPHPQLTSGQEVPTGSSFSSRSS